MTLTAVVVAAGGSSVSAEPASTPVPAGTVAEITDHIARALVPTLGDARWTRAFAAAPGDAVSLSAALGHSSLAAAVRRADAAVLAAKGLPANGPALLQIRLADPGMLSALRRGQRPLVAAAQTGEAGTTVPAHDIAGKTVHLDATRLPDRPVLVVDVDTDTALPLGLSVVRDALARHGISEARPAPAAMTSGYWATQVRAVGLADDKEPWLKGSAEIFGITGGFGLDGKATVDTVTMPYLDHDGTTYHPNQLIVHFASYKYDLADFVMMEDDGDTNYQALATALVGALLTIVDGGAYIPLVNAILAALPTSWWSDDPDYVDSWYTLATTTTGRVHGAAANGWLELAPYWVRPL